MAGYVILCFLAAFGVLCVLWVASGWLFPRNQWITVCLCRSHTQETIAIRRYGWLKDLGFLKGPLLLVDSTLSEQQRCCVLRKYSGIEFCCLEELPARLELERNRLD